MSIKPSLLLLFFATFYTQVNAQSPGWAWAKSACSLSAATSITAITTDPTGNIFIAGNFRDSALFGNTVYHPTGTINLFLAKYDSLGEFLWMQHARGANIPPYDLATAICTDSAGNCYVTGFFNGMALFGNDTVISLGSMPDVFIAKYRSSGNLEWLQQGTGSGSDYSYGIGLDANGNCYVSGSFQQGITFGNLALSANNASTDIFLIKLDFAGNFISASSAGGSASDQVNAMAVDKDGNCFVTGTFNSPDLVFGSDTLFFTNSGVDAFIAKFDSSGDALWGNAGSGPGNQEPSGVSVDQNGTCYVTGIFKSDTMFLDTTILITYGYYDFFTAKYDSTGNLTWAGHQGSATFGTEFSAGIASDTSGNFYTTGQFRNPATFAPLAVSSPAALSIFVTKFNPSGAAEWVEQSGSSSSSLSATAIRMDENGNIFITGSFELSTTFGNDSLIVSPGFNSGYYIAKLGNGNNTGIQTSEQTTSSIKVFPNPVIDKLHIEGLDEHATIMVFDMTGNLLLESKTIGMKMIDVKNFSPGMYLLEINTGRSLLRIKIIRL